MKVLIWLDSFPTYSETFIRTQILALIDRGVNVLIYPKGGKINESEIDSLVGFESYFLQNKVVNIDNNYRENIILRIIMILPVIFSKCFYNNLKIYYKSIQFWNYGKLSRSMRLFFRTHFIITNNIDIIHAHFGPNGNDSIVLKEIGLPLKIITTFHGYDIRLGNKCGGKIYSKLFQNSDKVISISTYNSMQLRNFGLSNNKMAYLPNAIDLNFYKRENSGIRTEGVIRIITVARLVEEKSIKTAIYAVNDVMQERKDFNFEYLIVGDGVLMENLKELVVKMKLSSKIKFLGALNSISVKELLINSDLFLLPSIAEALPTVLLEAQACKLIILATNVGSIKQIVRSGIVVEANNDQDFKNGLISLIDSRSQWKKMGEKGRDFIVENYSMTDYSQKLMGIYES